MKPRPQKKNPPTNPAPTGPSLRDQILADFTTLRVPVTAEQLDAALTDAEQNGRSHLEFLRRLLTAQAGLRRQRRIERLIKDANCPILPFPADHPREPDTLIEEYGDLFDSIGPFETTWHVDTRDLVFAHQKNPVDLYRTILRIDDARKPVFEEIGRSQLILSPMGNKALSLGILMAALERDFAVVSVESIAYNVDFTVLQSAPASSGELVHIWLHGDAYVGQGSKEGLSQ